MLNYVELAKTWPLGFPIEGRVPRSAAVSTNCFALCLRSLASRYIETYSDRLNKVLFLTAWCLDFCWYLTYHFTILYYFTIKHIFYVNPWMVQLYPPGEHCARVAAAGVGQNARPSSYQIRISDSSVLYLIGNDMKWSLSHVINVIIALLSVKYRSYHMLY